VSDLDARVAELAARYRPLAAELLRELVRLPADFVDRPHELGGDILCGLSNHERPRLELLRRRIVELGAVRAAEDVGFDDFGNLLWTAEETADGIPAREKRVIYFDGHADTVRALRPQWKEKIGEGIDAYEGLLDPSRIDASFLRRELGYLPPDEEWHHLLFGRGSADQLGGVVAQVFATKILLELAPEGALAGARVRSYATVSEEDNDGGGPLFLSRQVFPGAPAELIPDAVVLTEGTGDSGRGALGIYRGQRGRMQIELTVTGRSCHGSMPWEGLNPLEHGAAIVAEAASRHERGEGFLDHPFLGRGTRTASWSHLTTPSDCAVPERLVVRFDRRLTVGEAPGRGLADVESLDAVGRARAAGLDVRISVPIYAEPTWRGYRLGNPAVYMGWVTPEDHPAIQAAVETYRRAVSPSVAPGAEVGGSLRREPRVGRWIFSTDGVGYPVPLDDASILVAPQKRWVVSGGVKHPAMFGIGPGIEQNTHRIGECVDLRELQGAVAFLARFPGVFAARR
jgi:acetylornithine deacetylase/succinyl-diaminopimelate desuccinylase-like protein